MSTDGVELNTGVASAAGWSGSVLSVESRYSMSDALEDMDVSGKAQPCAEAATYEVAGREGLIPTEALPSGWMELFCPPSGVPGFHECSRRRDRRGRQSTFGWRFNQI